MFAILFQNRLKQGVDLESIRRAELLLKIRSDKMVVPSVLQTTISTCRATTSSLHLHCGTLNIQHNQDSVINTNNKTFASGYSILLSQTKKVVFSTRRRPPPPPASGRGVFDSPFSAFDCDFHICANNSCGKFLCIYLLLKLHRKAA